MGNKILHYPNLKTVLMVEDVLRGAETRMTRTDLKNKLPTKIMHQTLNLILEYLEVRGMIIDSHNGVLWTYNESPRLRKAIEKGVEV